MMLIGMIMSYKVHILYLQNIISILILLCYRINPLSIIIIPHQKKFYSTVMMTMKISFLLYLIVTMTMIIITQVITMIVLIPMTQRTISIHLSSVFIVVNILFQNLI